jgi:hypothetical protein
LRLATEKVGFPDGDFIQQSRSLRLPEGPIFSSHPRAKLDWPNGPRQGSRSRQNHAIAVPARNAPGELRRRFTHGFPIVNSLYAVDSWHSEAGFLLL